MNRRELENGMNEDEAIDAESRKLAVMLGALPRVESPANFEFGVKARIAQGRPSSGGMIPFFKLAAPLGLVLVVAAFMFFYGSLPLPADSAFAPVEPTSPVDIKSAEPLPESSVVEQTTASGPRVDDPIAQTERASIESQRPVPARRANTSDAANGSGFRDQTQRSANVIMPPGFESANPRNTNAGAAGDVPVTEILGILGITADFADGGWKVGSVMANSMADRSGVKTNDVIEAIDGRELKKDTMLKGEAGVKALRIRREGKQINVSLKN